MKLKDLTAALVMTLASMHAAQAVEPGIVKQAPVKATVTEKTLNKDVVKLAGVLPKVLYPTMSHHVGYDGAKFKLTVRFNTDMDRSTVIAGGTVMLNFPKSANALGQINWVNDREFTWTQHANRRLDICIYDPDCEFELILKDNIRSKEGLKIDGNKDNQQGGNFSLWYIDLG